MTELVNQMKGAVRPKRKRVKICMEAVERFTSPLLAAETLQPKRSKLLPHLVGAEGRRQGGFPLMCCCVHATTVSSWCQLSPSHMNSNGKNSAANSAANSATCCIPAIHPLMSANRCLYLTNGNVVTFQFFFAGYFCSGLICQQRRPKPARCGLSSAEKRCFFALFV